jgi:hypothetical protein
MRLPIAAVALAGTALVLAGCSEENWDDNKPDLNEIEDEAELRTIRLDDGREIECLFFAEGGSHRSWLAFDCDWDAR